MISVGEVIECSEVDGIDPHGRTSDGERWDDPGNRRKLSPAKP